MQPRVISLFSGCGGLDLGLEMAGAKTIFACDLFKDALNTLAANIPETHVELSDIRKITVFPDAEIVIGGYPCQGFSLAGKRLVTDDRNKLYKEYVRVLSVVQPTFFIAENVKGLLTMENGNIVDAMIQEFSEQGYKVKMKLVNAKGYGVAQDRERVFIVGVRNDIDWEYEFPEETHGEGKTPYVTMRDVLEGLPEPEPTDIDQTGFSPRFLSRNRKRDWDTTSFTIQASGRQAPLHPSGDPMLKVHKDKWIFQGETNRKLSYIECGLIQSFPIGYTFQGNLSNKYKMIGNAVPPLLALAISQPIVKFLTNQNVPR